MRLSAKTMQMFTLVHETGSLCREQRHIGAEAGICKAPVSVSPLGKPSCQDSSCDING